MVIGTQQKQTLNTVPVVAGDLADLHLIQRGRDRTHAVLGQHQTQQTGELLAVHFAVAQNLHKLVQHAAQDLPQLAVFLRQLCLSAGKQFLHHSFQRLRHAAVLGKMIKGLGLFPGTLPFPHLAVQETQRLCHRTPYLIDTCQLFPGPVVFLQSVAAGMGRPVLLLQPHLAPDLPAHHVVFQQVAIVFADTGQSRFEIAEHIFVFKAAGHSIHSAEQHGDYRFFQNIAAAADVGRDPGPGKGIVQNRAVKFHVPGRHANIPVAEFAAAHQLQNAGCRPLTLRVGRTGLPQLDGVRGTLPRLIAAEEMGFQMIQRRGAMAGQMQNFALQPRPLGHPHQPLTLTHRIIEQFFVSFFAQKRHRHAVGLTEDDLQNALFCPIEEGKAVQIDILAPQIEAFFQPIPQFLQTGSHISSLAVQPGVVGGKEHGQIPQLVTGGILHVLHLLPQRFRRNLIGVEFIGQLHQLTQKAGALAWAGKDLQLTLQLLQRHAHGQQLTAVIQREIGAAARFTQYTGGQILKAQHLRITGRRRTQCTAQVQLRFVGNMFRHQQYLLALASLCSHRLQYPCRLAAAGSSDPDRQHGSPPPFFGQYRKASVQKSVLSFPLYSFLSSLPMKRWAQK